MHPRTWLLITILSIVATCGLVAGFNCAFDIYGLYRPVRDRHLVAYGDPRVAKYLFNMRYVPENFDAVLIGSSMSANWDLRAIEKLRTYNNSVNGCNIVEQRAIVECALARPGLSTVFLIVHPYLTATHDFKTTRLSPDLAHSALGSLSLWAAYKDMLNIRLHRSQPLRDYAGTEAFGPMPRDLNANMKRLFAPGSRFEIDPVALETYRSFLAELRAHGIRIVFVVPPLFEGLLDSKREAFDNYARMIQAESRAGDKWIDFTSDSFAAFRKDRSNFVDGVHMVPGATRQVVAHLNAAVNQ